jgi:hypothetical protein
LIIFSDRQKPKQFKLSAGSKFTSRLKLQPQLRFIPSTPKPNLDSVYTPEKKKKTITHLIASSFPPHPLPLYPSIHSALVDQRILSPATSLDLISPPTFSPLISLGFQQQNSDNEF